MVWTSQPSPRLVAKCNNVCTGEFSRILKLARILKSKLHVVFPISTVDLIDFYIRKPHERRDNWLPARTVLSIANVSWNVTVPVCGGRTVQVAYEDIHATLREDSFVQPVQMVSMSLIKLLKTIMMTAGFRLQIRLCLCLNIQTILKIFFILLLSSHLFFDGTMSPSGTTSEYARSISSSTENIDLSCTDHIKVTAPEDRTSNQNTPNVDDRVEIFRPLDSAFFPRLVSEEQEGNKTVLYEDGKIQTLNLAAKIW